MRSIDDCFVGLHERNQTMFKALFNACTPSMETIDSIIDFGGECQTQIAFFTGILGIFGAVVAFCEWQFRREETEES